MTEPKRERTLYEIASSFFALVVIAFGLGGMVITALGDEGPLSGAFAICGVFVLLGLGRLYLGLRRGAEGAEEATPPAVDGSTPSGARTLNRRSRSGSPRGRRTRR